MVLNVMNVTNTKPLVENPQGCDKVRQNCDTFGTNGDTCDTVERNLRQTATTATIASLVRDWVDVSDGYFNVNDVYRDLGISDRKHKGAVKKSLERLVNARVLKRKDGVNGMFRRVMVDADDIDWFNSDSSKVVEITWPFALEKWVKLFPKSIVVIAGSPNSGKTAFMLNLIYLNQFTHDVDYYNSEMGPEELKDRLSKFPMSLEDWSFKCKSRNSNFADVIHPEHLNLIDFLEVTDNFYQVGAEITDIFNTLTSGCAVIALQKKEGARLGRGAEFSLEKPRLYLSIDSGKLTIVKGKNWADPIINPNGHEFSFKLVQGHEFILI